MLRCMVILSVLLMTAANVRAQCEIPVVGENRILTDESNKPPFLDGSTVKFKCATGYLPARSSASRTITCTGTQWSDLELQCKKRSCGNPGEISNGKYLIPDGIVFGATITAVCNEGYQLLGAKDRNCREQGWDGRPPVCEVVKCKAPPPIENGTFYPDQEFYGYEEAVTYSCKRGLDLIGPSVITCSSDGSFQPPPPKCLLVTCESPQISNAVRVEGKSPPYKHRHFVRYQCNKGYRMEGDDKLICTEKGWDPPPPQCAVITCPKPPAINNGQFAPLKEFYEYGQTVTYSCNQGFRVTQPSTTSCTDDGTFKTAPQCLVKTCPKPPAINNGQFAPLKEFYEYGQTVTYSCNQGFRVTQPSTISCTHDGTFETAPQCLVTTCPKPPAINNGQFAPLKEFYEYGQTVTYSCNQGFNVTEPSTISCTDDGTFETAPQCLDDRTWRILLIIIIILIILRKYDLFSI
ncbi:C4b-binding protein alpha chain-like [Clarias gariepinus]|uniref:C4b-binding protein alpha chain-like n=1 Tax=Clarias gariepinus TaxID=13013 RepID=UPI00234C1725|nr:C4b-binding protein alpha chain-like [Clarias gariepinus]XP_053338713.1 C4b-binding protein alpha chain-like [Clarias gariepinus]